MASISLIPLSLEHHIEALQQVYRATRGYWNLYHFPSSPAGQAENDLKAASETPGRTIMGIVRRVVEDDPSQGAEMVGMIDFRLHWPGHTVASIGMMMVVEPFQRQGIGTQAWSLLVAWLAASAGMTKARLGVEQFNPGALKFFEQVHFRITGETSRIKVGEKFVRLLYMEQELTV